MGNELAADQQNGQVFNSLLTNLNTNQSPLSLFQPQDSIQNPTTNPSAPNDFSQSPLVFPPAIVKPASNSNNYSAFRGNKFARGD